MIKAIKKQQGTALILALLITVFAAALAIALISYQTTSARYANFANNFERVLLYVQGSEWIASELLIEKIEHKQQPQQGWSDRRNDAAKEEDDSDTSPYDSYGQAWAEPIKQTPVQDAQISLLITDQQALFNINSLTAVKPEEDEDDEDGDDDDDNGSDDDDDGDDGENGDDENGDDEEVDEDSPTLLMFKRLLIQLELSEDIADIIIAGLELTPTQTSRIQDDDEPVKYRKLIDTSELLLIDDLPIDAYTKLLPHITVLPEETKVNINTASAEIIMSLGEDITKPLANQFIDQRKQQPEEGFNKIADVELTVIGKLIDTSLVTLTSSYFLLTTDVYFNGIQNTWLSWLKRQETTNDDDEKSAEIKRIKRAKR